MHHGREDSSSFREENPSVSFGYSSSCFCVRDDDALMDFLFHELQDLLMMKEVKEMHIFPSVKVKGFFFLVTLVVVFRFLFLVFPVGCILCSVMRDCFVVVVDELYPLNSECRTFSTLSLSFVSFLGTTDSSSTFFSWFLLICSLFL